MLRKQKPTVTPLQRPVIFALNLAYKVQFRYDIEFGLGIEVLWYLAILFCDIAEFAEFFLFFFLICLFVCFLRFYGF